MYKVKGLLYRDTRYSISYCYHQQEISELVKVKLDITIPTSVYFYR